jgi:outer membrane autotransporter protein
VSGLAYHADVTWLATPLTTVRFGAGAEVGESTVGGSGGYLAQYGEVGVDHELLRNVILDGSFRFENADYEDVSRNDDYIDAGVGVSYLVNRYAKVRVGYDYAERSSDAVGLDYEENRVGISLILQR